MYSEEGVNIRVVGIDLAGSENQITGLCFMDESLNTKTKALHKDEEIIAETERFDPDVISIDAPLCLPKGRKSLEKKGPPHLRVCDRELLKMKIKFFPITLGPMRKLTERGMRLRKHFEGRGIEVIETYPGAAQDLLKIPRKNKGIEKLKDGLEKVGLKKLNDNMTDDELDAVTCALVGKMYLENNYLAIGNPEEILMILPKP